MAQVTLENVWKIYDGKVVSVKDFNLVIRDREFMVLVGPSGCGKSTTLRMIAGLEEISRGTVKIGDRVVNDIPPKNRDIAMVFQNYALYPHMTVRENMAFGLKLRHLPSTEIRERVEVAAKMLGLEEYLDRKPKALSGGQRQRVAVGRAIVRQPAVFLFDEPLSNLDAKMRVQMRAEISRLQRHLQCTMIYVTHDQIEAMTMGDRICVMKDGVIQQVDEPLNIYNRPCNIFVAGFIGTPPMNFIRGRVEAVDGKPHFYAPGIEFELPQQWYEGAAPVINKPAVLGIRPEAVGESHPDPLGEALFTATVDIVEPMGAEQHVYCTAGENHLVALLAPERHYRIGDTITLSVQLSRLHLFDPESEKALPIYADQH